MKKKFTLGSTLMLLMLAVVTTFNITFYVASEYYNVRLGNFEEMEGEYQQLKEVSQLVDKYFVGEYDKQDMMDQTLKGYIQGTVGAGDAFCAGVLYAAAHELPMDQALKLGVCTAAASLSRVGASEGVETAETVLQLFDRYGV